MTLRKILQVIAYIPSMVMVSVGALFAQIVATLIGMVIIVMGIMTGDMFREGYDWKTFRSVMFGGFYIIANMHTNYWKK